MELRTTITAPARPAALDAIDWVLPNGVEFTLSMEVYTDLARVNHEAEGVPVDVETGFDASVDAAIEHLS